MFCASEHTHTHTHIQWGICVFLCGSYVQLIIQEHYRGWSSIPTVI